MTVRFLLISPFLFALLQCIHSSGHAEIHLKSAFALNATVEVADNVYFPVNKKVYNVPMMPNQKWVLGNVPVAFGKSGMVWINSGPIKRLGIAELILKAERWDTRVMTISSEKLNLPFTGFRIEIKCDTNWHGLHCDNFCDESRAQLTGKRCNRLGRLGCPKGFRGWHCDEPIANEDPNCGCQNGGTCVSSFWWQYEVDTLICECPNGFEGDKCERKSFDYTDLLRVHMVGSDSTMHRVTHFANYSLSDNEFY